MNCRSIPSIRLIRSLSVGLKVGAILSVFFVTTKANADGWALFSEHAHMRGYVIADVGELSAVDPPFNAKWENDVYQINGRCFSFAGYNGHLGYGKKAALLLVDAQKHLMLALIESSIGSIKTEMKSVTMLECPSGSPRKYCYPGVECEAGVVGDDDNGLEPHRYCYPGVDCSER